MAPPLSFRPDSTAAAIFVYSLADAEAALVVATALKVPVVLWVHADIAAGCGADVVGQMFACARASAQDAAVLTAADCGDAAGLALALLRRGIDRVRLSGPPDMLSRVANIASGTGAALAPLPIDALDLIGVEDPKKACLAWLRRFKTSKHHATSK